MGNSNSNSPNISGWNHFPSSASLLPYYPSKDQFTEFLYELPSLISVPRVILDIIAQYYESPINSLCINSSGQIIQTIGINNTKPVIINYLLNPFVSNEQIIACIPSNDERLIICTSGIEGHQQTGIGRIHGRLLIYDVITNKVQYELNGHTTTGPCSFIRFISILLLPNNMFAAICKCKLLHIFKLYPKPTILHVFKLPQQIRPSYRKSYFQHKHYFMQLLPFNRIAVCITPFVRETTGAVHPIIIKSPSLNSSQSPNIQAINNNNDNSNNNNNNNNINDTLPEILPAPNFALPPEAINSSTPLINEESKEDYSSTSPPQPQLHRRISTPRPSIPAYTTFFCV